MDTAQKPGIYQSRSEWSRLARIVLAAPIAWAALAATARAQADPPQSAPTPPTFTRDVAPILFAKCTNCHRKEQSGPFPLQTYEHARKRAKDIATVVMSQSMPPWKPQAGVGPKLKHDISLTEQEIDLLDAWAEAGAPEGDPNDLPAPPEFAEGWSRGAPDLVLEPEEGLAIPASGPDLYRCYVLPTNLARDVYVSMIDFQPSNPRVVHHITAYIDVTGAARQRDKAEKGPGYTSFSGPGIPRFEMMGFWAAGHEPTPLPDGVGLRLARQSDVILQVHYHPTGKPEVDRPRLGIYLSRTPVKQALHWNGAQNTQFRLPAGASDVEVRGSWFVPVDLEALAISPHMHLLGKSMRISVTRPNGQSQDLISIPDWDPNWQSTYFFEEPIPLPVGSVVHVVAHFDNSAHPRNPNHPPKPVEWGHRVEDEMCDAFIAVVKKGQDLTQLRARDDLAEIFSKQRIRNLRRELEKRSR